jgi:hypothetical protein
VLIGGDPHMRMLCASPAVVPASGIPSDSSS